jgi:hypothetical protein
LRNGLHGRKKADFSWQSSISEDALPLTIHVSMGQSTVAHTLHEKILTNWMQGVFLFVFFAFSHLKAWRLIAKTPNHILLNTNPPFLSQLGLGLLVAGRGFGQNSTADSNSHRPSFPQFGSPMTAG